MAAGRREGGELVIRHLPQVRGEEGEKCELLDECWDCMLLCLGPSDLGRLLGPSASHTRVAAQAAPDFQKTEVQHELYGS